MDININHCDSEALCIQEMAANNQPINGPLIVNNERFNRYSRDRNQSKKDEWYIAWSGVTSWGAEYFICVYGSWSDDSKYVFKSFDNSVAYSASQNQELYNMLQARMREAEQKHKAQQNEAAFCAAEIWEQATEQPLSEEYTQYAKLKGIEPGQVRYGLYYDKYPSIIVDIRNTKHEIRSLQYIWVDEHGKSQKRFLTDGEKKGNFHVVGAIIDGKLIYITEGYATGVSVYTATGAATVVAFGAGNIESVTETIKTKYPNNPITIAGDGGTTGIEKATEAAKKFGCAVVFPQFPEGKKLDTDGESYTDFNDLHQVAGTAEVALQLQKAVSINTHEEELKELAHNLDTKEDPCEDFKVTDLPEPLRDYISSLCETTDAHPIMITASVLVTVSAFLQTKVLIPKPYYYQDLYPNLWLLCVAQSGQFKTTALNTGAEVALEQQASVFKAMKKFEHDIKSTADSTDQLELKGHRLSESRKNVVLPTRLTGEALIQHMAQGHKGAIYASEFGAWLQNLYKNHNNDLKGIFTDLFDVPDNWRNLTKTQGDDILEKPFISICGYCPVPWLKKTTEEDDVATGFLARFLIFTLPNEDTIPAGLPATTTSDRRLAKERFESKLRDILAAVGACRQFTLSDDAQRFFDNADDNSGLHQQIHLFIQSQDEKVREVLAPFAKRWSPYLLKIGVITQLFDDPKSTQIGVRALESASSILFAAMQSTAYLFKGELGESEFQRKCRKLMEYIYKKTKKTGKSITRKDILMSRQLQNGAEEYDKVLNTLIDAGKLILEPKQPKGQSLYSLPVSVETVEHD